MLDLGGSEQKFADVGRFVGETLPANAVVYAQQHGGNVRFYSNRLTLRFDILDPDWLDRLDRTPARCGLRAVFSVGGVGSAAVQAAVRRPAIARRVGGSRSP